VAPACWFAAIKLQQVDAGFTDRATALVSLDS
jgi:hypothetical protein